MTTSRVPSSTLIVLVRVQAGLCLLVGAIGGLFAAAVDTESVQAGGWFTKHDASIGEGVLLYASAVGIVLLVALHAARRGSANGWACLLCVDVLLLMLTLALAVRGALAGLPVLLVVLNAVTLGSALVENNRRPVAPRRRD